MQSKRRVFDAQPNAENSARRVNCDSVRQKLTGLLDDDGPTFEGLCSGEARKQEGWQRIHFVCEYFTESYFLSSYFIYPNASCPPQKNIDVADFVAAEILKFQQP
ncbi:MAG: hypothetical protein ABSC60_14420 [Acidobacteriota bacterium]|jgi:hypothetical protein